MLDEERNRSVNFGLGTDDGFAIDKQQTENGLLLVPRGELDLAAVEKMEAALRGAQEASSLVVLDLRQVPFMDSSGLHAVIAADLRIREEGGRLVIVQGGPQIRRLLELTGAQDQLETVADPAEVL